MPGSTMKRSVLLFAVFATAVHLRSFAQNGGEEPQGPSIQSIGPALDGDIVSVFIPPTRSKEPYVATQDAVYKFSSKQDSWIPIYKDRLPARKIIVIAGYEKSSKVLYIAHGLGGAQTKNAGGSWTEFTLPHDRYEQSSWIRFIVNPTNRKEAVLARSNSAWATRDYGATWETLAVPSNTELIVGLGYAQVEKPILVLATEQAVYSSDDLGRSWRTLLRSPTGPRFITVSPSLALSIVQDRASVLRALDLSRPGFQLVRNEALPADARMLATDCAARGAVWFVTGNQIDLFGLQGAEHVSVLYEASASIKNLIAHPRIPDAIFWSEGPHLYQLTQAFGDQTQSLTARISTDLFTNQQPDLIAMQKQETTSPVERKAEQWLATLLASQPPVEEAIAAALGNANQRPGEIERWKALVRKRNLLPQLRIGAQTTERALDQSDRVVNVDRFGVSKPDDIREDDRVEFLDSYRIDLQWNLGDLLFNRDEIFVSREARYRADQRNKLITQVSKLYYQRLDLMLEDHLNGGLQDSSIKLKRLLQIQEVTNVLNQICGRNLFSTSLESLQP